MSMYNMSASVPNPDSASRALRGRQTGRRSRARRRRYSGYADLPELIPSKEGELTQRTEDTLGAYALHDFFLYHMMDSGASPLKLYPMAKAAFNGQYDDLAILGRSAYIRPPLLHPAV